MIGNPKDMIPSGVLVSRVINDFDKRSSSGGSSGSNKGHLQIDHMNLSIPPQSISPIDPNS
jgi:hypothetical protein